MESKIIFAFAFILVTGFVAVKAELDEYGNDYSESETSFAENDKETSFDDKETSFDENDKDLDMPAEVKKPLNEDYEAPRMVPVEDMNSETTALVQSDPDKIKNKGLCHHSVAIWYKPGIAIRCNCLKCTCRPGGKWDCTFNFAYCPYYYCGNQIYNPYSQVCCCGKIQAKKANFNCCGYFYYNTRVSKCCNYYSVKPKKLGCPRYRL